MVKKLNSIAAGLRKKAGRIFKRKKSERDFQPIISEIVGMPSARFKKTFLGYNQKRYEEIISKLCAGTSEPTMAFFYQVQRDLLRDILPMPKTEGIRKKDALAFEQQIDAMAKSIVREFGFDI
jgi:hypothetical protein